MVSDGSYTAVLDRFEPTDEDVELAVLLLEADGEVVDEVAVERSDLPIDGRHVDAVFDLVVDGGEIATHDYLPAVTDERSEAAQSRFDRLSSRPPDDDADESE